MEKGLQGRFPARPLARCDEILIAFAGRMLRGSAGRKINLSVYPHIGRNCMRLFSKIHAYD